MPLQDAKILFLPVGRWLIDCMMIYDEEKNLQGAKLHARFDSANPYSVGGVDRDFMYYGKMN